MNKMSKRPFGGGGGSSISKRIRRSEVETSPSSYDQQRLIQHHGKPRPLVDLAYKEVRVNWPLAQVPEHIVQESAAGDIQIFYQKFMQEQVDIAEGCRKIIHEPKKYPKASIIECIKRALLKLYIHYRLKAEINTPQSQRFTQHSYLFREVGVDINVIENMGIIIMEKLFDPDSFEPQRHFFEDKNTINGNFNEKGYLRDLRNLVRAYINSYITLLKGLPKELVIQHLLSFKLDLESDNSLLGDLLE